MTVKEIADAVGKSERSVQRWIEKTTTEKISVVNDKMSLVNSIKSKAGSKDSVHPADYDLDEALLIIEAGLGKNAAGVFRANAEARNALVAKNDVSARLDRIEQSQYQMQNAIARLVLEIKKQPYRLKEMPELDKERHFHYFAAKNICFALPNVPIKRIDVWYRYEETVEKINRLDKKSFFERLAILYPQMTMAQTRIGPCFQFFCYGICLKREPYQIQLATGELLE